MKPRSVDEKSVDEKSYTDIAIDRLGSLLIGKMEELALADQIPDGAHLFHGTFDAPELTQHSLKLAGDILLGMLLGYVEKAPLILLYEYQPAQMRIIDLASDTHKQEALEMIQSFQTVYSHMAQNRLALAV